MNGTLNANVSSNNAQWAHIKSLEKQLDALKGDVNADSSLIASLQKELDEYKTSQANEINASYINANTLLDVKGTTHLEDNVRIDGDTTTKAITSTNLIVASTFDRDFTKVSPNTVSTKTVSASDVSAYSGKFSVLKGVDEITATKATITDATIENSTINTLTTENVVINSDLNFPKVDSKIVGEYLDIEAKNIDADKLSTSELDVTKTITTPSITTDKVKTESVETNDITTSQLNSDAVKTNSIEAKDVKAEGLDINSINVSDLLNSSDTIEITPGAKVLISGDDGQLKTAIIRDVASSELKLDGYIPYELTTKTASSYGYDINSIEGIVIKYSKDKIYTTKATYSLLNGTLKKDEDNFKGFNFITIKGNVGLSYDDTNRKFSWVDLSTSEVLGEASLSSSMTYSDGSFHHSGISTIASKAFYPIMVGKAIVFIDVNLGEYGSFYKNNTLHINNYHWQNIPEINIDEYNVNYKVYLNYNTYTTFTCYTAVSYTGNIYNNSSLKCNEKEWLYAYSSSSGNTVYYTDGTSEGGIGGKLLGYLSSSNVILSDVGTNIGAKDTSRRTIINYTVDSLESDSIVKNAEYEWGRGTPTELGTTISGVWFTSSQWENEVWVNNGNFETYIPFKAKDIEATNIVADNVTVGSMNITSGVTLDTATINSLTSDAIKAKSITADELKFTTSPSASIGKLKVGTIESDGVNASSIKKGGYVSILGSTAPISDVKADSLDITTSEYIEQPEYRDASTVVSNESYEPIWGKWIRQNYKYFYVNNGEVEFKFEAPLNTSQLNIQYKSDEAIIVYANTLGVYSYHLQTFGYFDETYTNYPEEMGEIRGTSGLIYAKSGASYTYINDRWFETTKAEEDLATRRVIVTKRFLLFKDYYSSRTQYFHATYTQPIENIVLKEALGLPTLLNGWKFNLDGETYQPEAVSIGYNSSDGTRSYTMFDGYTATTINSSTSPTSIGLLTGSIYNYASSTSKAFASTIFDNNNSGNFISTNDLVLQPIESDKYWYTVPPTTEDGQLSFVYGDGTIYSQYKKTTKVGIDESGITTPLLVFNGTNGSVKRKYVYGNYWSELKDLTLVDVKGFELSGCKVIERITGLYSQTDSEIILTKQAMGSDTIEKLTIDNTWTETPAVNEGYRFIVDYY